MKTRSLSSLIQSFFTQGIQQRGLSPLTILSYRDAIKLMLQFACRKVRRPVVKLRIGDITPEVVMDFLSDLETARNNQVATRNNRLTAIRCFFAHVAAEDPALADQCHRICTIPPKRFPTRSVPYLERDEMRAILDAPDTATRRGRRDYAILLFLYNTGARVQELTGLNACDLQLDRPHQVLLRGKGQKERICPLWEETAGTLQRLLDETETDRHSPAPVFRNGRMERLSRFGVGYILRKHASTAARDIPSISRKRVSPHTVRHTTAVHLLNSGVDLNVIRAWLGHADIKTTNIYAEIDLAAKRKAIETCAPTPADGGKRKPVWQKNPDILTWLENL